MTNRRDYKKRIVEKTNITEIQNKSSYKMIYSPKN